MKKLFGIMLCFGVLMIAGTTFAGTKPPDPVCEQTQIVISPGVVDVPVAESLAYADFTFETSLTATVPISFVRIPSVMLSAPYPDVRHRCNYAQADQCYPKTLRPIKRFSPPPVFT